MMSWYFLLSKWWGQLQQQSRKYFTGIFSGTYRFSQYQFCCYGEYLETITCFEVVLRLF